MREERRTMITEGMSTEEHSYLVFIVVVVCASLIIYTIHVVRSTQVAPVSTPLSSTEKVKKESGGNAIQADLSAARKGKEYAEKGEIELALDYLTEAIAFNGEDYESILCRSKVYFKKFQNLDENNANTSLISHMLLQSLQDADACITLSSDDDRGFVNKISILKHIGEVSQAKSLCKDALSHLPHSESLSQMSTSLENETDYNEAEEFEKMLNAAYNSAHHMHNCTKKSISPSPSMGDECMNCGLSWRKKKLLLCSACKSVSYCGKECQIADRKVHKAICKLIIEKKKKN